MSLNFEKLTGLPILDLHEEFIKLKDAGIINWFKKENGEYAKDQICINSIPGRDDNIFYGRGSLFKDWDNFYFDADGNLQAPMRDTPLKETDFNSICTPFKETLFEEVFNALNNNFYVGRVRIMNSKPKTCLTWHVDDTPRIHYPMKTQEGCFMVIENEVMHLEKNTWYYTNTLKKHTAFNSSKEERIHLVVSFLGRR